jgi:hypothetical protein
MKLISAVIKPFKLERRSPGFGEGRQGHDGHRGQGIRTSEELRAYRGAEYSVDFVPKTKTKPRFPMRWWSKPSRRSSAYRHGLDRRLRCSY